MSDLLLSNNKLRVRESNTNLVISTLKHSHKATCAEISKTTGLSVATCGNIIKKLLSSGEILEGGFESYSSGRPAKQYVYNKNFSLVIAITLHEEQSTKLLQYAVANLYGEIIEKNIKNYPQITSDIINEVINKLLDSYSNIKSIGLGVPAVITKDDEIKNCDISELNNTTISQLIKTDKQDIKIAANRSPALSIYGYHTKHANLKDKISAAILCPATPPIGAGFVVNDQIYNGYYNIGGEIGNIANKYLDKFMPEPNEDNIPIRNTMFAISSIISTINPSTIVLMGADFSDSLYNQICSYCNEFFDSSYLPEFILLRDYSDAYINGTIQIAIDCLNPKVKLVIK